MPDTPPIYAEFNDALRPVMADAELVKYAIHQILDNAQRFTPQDGEIHVSFIDQPDYITLEVKDSGMGIAQEHIPRIFDTLWRQDSAHSTPGLGLGLYFAKKIIDYHQGNLSVDSQLGHGTTVHIRLLRSSF